MATRFLLVRRASAALTLARARAWPRVLILACLSAVLVAGAADAQVVSGRVVDSASALPVPGAVIQAIGSDGRVFARTLSDGRGSFALRLGDSLSTQLRVQRIGFRPRLLPRPSDNAATLEIALQRIPAFLDPVRVVAAQCRRRGRTSPTGLIEQARAGLLASVVARDVNPAAMTRITYERRYNRDSTRVVSQLVRVDSSISTQNSFSAVNDAAGFVRRGFLEEGEGVQTYFAPDAETLLDDAFAAGYCFRVMPASRERPNQVGLGFQPAGRTRGRVDVDGALWIDTAARELRDIEFRYVGLPRTMESRRPGGRLEFATLPNGVTLVSRWQLNLVGVEVDSFPSRRAGSWSRLFHYFRYESGGELARATWRDGSAWRAPLGTLVGHATWENGLPARSVRFALRGSPFVGISDSAGRVVIPGIVPGQYDLVVIDDQLLPLGLGIGTGISIRSDRDTVTQALRGLTADDYVMTRCDEMGRYDPDDPNDEQTFVLARVLWDDGRPVDGATWSAHMLVGNAWTEIEVEGRTGSDGVIVVCQDLRPDHEVELRILPPLAAPGSAPVSERRRLLTTTTLVPVVLPRP